MLRGADELSSASRRTFSSEQVSHDSTTSTGMDAFLLPSHTISPILMPILCARNSALRSTSSLRDEFPKSAPMTRCALDLSSRSTASSLTPWLPARNSLSFARLFRRQYCSTFAVTFGRPAISRGKWSSAEKRSISASNTTPGARWSLTAASTQQRPHARPIATRASDTRPRRPRRRSSRCPIGSRQRSAPRVWSVASSCNRHSCEPL